MQKIKKRDRVIFLLIWKAWNCPAGRIDRNGN